ncbi:SDR family NAD(P)-dependent oxidoreductase [soil metagenome]
MPAIPKNASCIVTGAGSGFGRAIALALGARGGRVLATDVDEATLAETVEMLKSRGVTATAMPCDVRDAKQVEAMVQRAKTDWNAVDVIVNNAGVAVVGPVGEVSLEDWRFEIDINLYGVIYGCHFAVPIMREQGRGWILNVASAAGLLSPPEMGPYNVTKAGVVALTETLSAELDGTGVSASALCPTFFRTNIAKAQRSPEGLKKQSAHLVENAKWSADEIAQVALRGLESGRLYVIPQNDGKFAWGMKRMLGNAFPKLAAKAALRMKRR